MAITKKQILKLAEIDEKLKKLHDVKNTYIKKLIDKNGPCEGVTTITGEKPFLRVKLINNLELLESGNTLYKSTGFNAYDVKIDRLKNKPK